MNQYRVFKVGKWPLHVTQNKGTAINVGKLIPTKEESENLAEKENIIYTALSIPSART